VDSLGSGYRPVTGFCEWSDKPLFSVAMEVFSLMLKIKQEKQYLQRYLQCTLDYPRAD
jgi:hypothetical protein